MRAPVDFERLDVGKGLVGLNFCGSDGRIVGLDHTQQPRGLPGRWAGAIERHAANLRSRVNAMPNGLAEQCGGEGFDGGESFATAGDHPLSSSEFLSEFGSEATLGGEVGREFDVNGRNLVDADARGVGPSL